ncbi:MAG: Dam family site-specific DNA-(adenine-N6)-methyltransferase [Candidatus Marsarchaeota archaeon]|nr:Dam family site-specific DNA-(adenine-N6)-methyltransferase [Candidatus Marsarchaeota archaeon]
MDSNLLPFLKWPGGKRWLAPHFLKLVDGIEYERYVEPFLGGGAMFFAVQPKNAVLSDINADLINTYIQVRDHPQETMEALRGIPVDKETYLAQREANPRDRLRRAVRFLYLNRTAFAGMYRVNRQGRFNVPFGGGERTPELLWKDDYLLQAAGVLRNAKIKKATFRTALRETGKGDLVYCDPAYTAVHNNGTFIRYNEKNFSWSDQIRLAKACKAAAARGAVVVVSNAFSSDVAGLYEDAEIQILDRKTLLCPKPAKRGPAKEYLIVLKPPTA